MKTEKKDPIDWKIVVGAMILLTILEIVAMFLGFNGKFFAVIAAMIGALAGLNLPQLKIRGH